MVLNFIFFNKPVASFKAEKALQIYKLFFKQQYFFKKTFQHLIVNKKNQQLFRVLGCLTHK